MSFTQDVKTELKEVVVQKRHCLTAAAFATELLSAKKDVDKQSTTIIELIADKANLILERPCCKRSFLRSAFLTSGMVADPKGQYHFEIVSRDMATAALIRDTAAFFGPVGHIVARKEKFVFYIKDADAISDMLNICEAHRSLMDFENKRILKDLRNNVNRQVNCETANLKKTISAATRQVEDILYLKECGIYEELSPELKETCEIRLLEPEMSLTELLPLFTGATSRSGVNHRFQRIHQLATEQRSKKGREE